MSYLNELKIYEKIEEILEDYERLSQKTKQEKSKQKW